MAANMGESSITRAGSSGMTRSSAYEESMGGVTNGSAKRPGRCSTPRSFPSMNSTAAKPNMTLTKNAPNRSTLVACQTQNCTCESL